MNVVDESLRLDASSGGAVRGSAPTDCRAQCAAGRWTPDRRCRNDRRAGARIRPRSPPPRLIPGSSGGRPMSPISSSFPGTTCGWSNTLITNFHQPRATHLLLVEALIGRERLAAAYSYALANSFRFLSYGDGMFIV